MSLCERFPSLTPFEIRKQSFYEVFLLVRRMQRYNKGRRAENTEKVKYNPKTKEKVIRRPASDDWY